VVHAHEGARLAVVQLEPLAHGLDGEGAVGIGQPALVATGARVGCRVWPERRVRALHDLSQDAHSAANASRAAAAVRWACPASCARDGNQASYCDGGGYTPRSSNARQKAACASMSQAWAPV